MREPLATGEARGRTYPRTVYGDVPGAGLAPVYGLGPSRFLADQRPADQLVLSLYGAPRRGMSSGRTYISGEAVSVLPLNGAYDLTMFMPPSTGANASYLGTLRELLVHERRDGLDLAFSTPRAWLADGRRIVVRDAPTRFGDVSYTLARRGAVIQGRLVLPPHASARLRLRVPAGERLVRVFVDGAAVSAGTAGTIAVGDRPGAVWIRATVT